MKLLEDYFKLQENIYQYFGYKEDWVVIPLSDNTEFFWGVEDCRIKYAGTLEAYNSDGDYYESEIYTQRFLPKHIYRTDDYTMICEDTKIDGNKFLSVFDNAKEITVRG